MHPERLAEIDALKLAGAVAVVLIHTLRPPWDPDAPGWETWIGYSTRFAVPAFLFASGYLYASSSPIPWARTASRLRRVLLPYLLASLLAQGWWWARGRPWDTVSRVLDLLLGSSFGPYYYVFVIVGLVLASPLFARLSPRALLMLTLACVAVQWAFDAFPFRPIYWYLRNPLLWWAYFLVGWSARLHAGALRAFVAAHRPGLGRAAVATLATLVALMALHASLPTLLVRSLSWLEVYVVLATLVILTQGTRSAAWVRFGSDASYAIYLFQLFFVLSVRVFLCTTPGVTTVQLVLLSWIVGVAGPLVLVASGRALLGERSRLLLGA